MGQEKNLRKKVFSGLLWTYAERIGAQGVSFILSIILARLLEPEHYGTVALVTVFISICNVFISRGFGDAVIQKSNVTVEDFSTAFWLNLFAGIGLYIILFFFAPYIANFYKTPILINVVRIMALRIPIAAINCIQQAYVSKKMEFKKFFFSTLGGTITSACIGIILAFYGFGIWALVSQYMINTFMDTLILWFSVKWRPTFIYSSENIRSIFSFGWKVTVSSLISTICNELRSLLIAKKYTSSDLAYYNKAINFPKLIITSVDDPIEKVLFPTFAK